MNSLLGQQVVYFLYLMVRGKFTLDLSEINHVLLYYSCNLDHCLMMCKANNKYINISAPIEKKLINTNFIAVYCGAT